MYHDEKKRKKNVKLSSDQYQKIVKYAMSYNFPKICHVVYMCQVMKCQRESYKLPYEHCKNCCDVSYNQIAMVVY